MKKIIILMAIFLSACSNNPPKVPINSVDIIEEKTPPQISESYPLPELPKDISSDSKNITIPENEIKIESIPINTSTESQNEINIE